MHLWPLGSLELSFTAESLEDCLEAVIAANELFIRMEDNPALEERRVAIAELENRITEPQVNLIRSLAQENPDLELPVDVYLLSKQEASALIEKFRSANRRAANPPAQAAPRTSGGSQYSNNNSRYTNSRTSSAASNSPARRSNAATPKQMQLISKLANEKNLEYPGDNLSFTDASAWIQEALS